MRRLYLVRHAPTAATRSAAFPFDEPLDEGGRAAAAAFEAPRHDEAVCSPARRCRETADAAGLAAPSIDAALAECDFGSWAGQSLADVHARDAGAAAAWMTDPDACPHGGESLTAFADRVGTWLDAQAKQESRRLVAVTHGGVVKAAIVRAVGAPLRAFWQFDVAPLSVTELHGRDGRWTIAGVNRPAGARRAAGAEPVHAA